LVYCIYNIKIAPILVKSFMPLRDLTDWSKFMPFQSNYESMDTYTCIHGVSVATQWFNGI